ncbi:putative proteasome-type protease [Kushneria sinocarnis]|uniref:Putative proteasome-type protease n=1 Tax=Kushneria sinocarnis TaxID=595502 RepID=A0A420WWV2_9GAMM|nr:peptidase [Kushneria sinocarnis]RKR04219.1 putative proteasome-type protease [Kushneria sinocarnis]
MTYCVAMALGEGVVCISDTRTNAGIDQIASVRKLMVYGTPNERALIIQTAGNLSTSQAVLTRLEQQFGSEGEHLLNVPTLFDVARLVGTTLKGIVADYGSDPAMQGIDVTASFLIAGQIRGGRTEVYNVYPQGNFIAATPDTPYFQIGESKYGKPVLDRVLDYHTPLNEALRCGLVSFDSTLRSNLSVGMPLDIALYPNDLLTPPLIRRINEDDDYFTLLRSRWSSGLQALMESIDPPEEPYWRTPPA